MKLEKYVVVFENVVPQYKSEKDIDYNELMSLLHKMCEQYIVSAGFKSAKSYEIEIDSSTTLKAEYSAGFVLICNVTDEPYNIALCQTNDHIRIQPKNVLVIPNHPVFNYMFTKPESEFNVIGYLDLNF